MKRRQLLVRSLGTGLAVMLLRANAIANTVAAAGSSLAQRLVTSFDRAFDGPHAGFRANHAKGILCVGEFTPSAAAATLSVAAHFRQRVKTTARFSNFGGLPFVPDASAGATPHGLAVKFHLPDGTETDMIGHSVPFFPSPTPEAFDEFLHALRGGAATMGPFAATRPKVAQFLGGLKPPPRSFATIAYYYIDAFTFVDAAGTRRHVRYSMIPVLAETYLSADRAKAQPPNYLIDEIATRLRNDPVLFDYIAQIANDDDPTNDPTHYWPADRRTVVLGRLRLTAVVANNRAAQQRILFDPSRLTAGIELTDDPLVPVRSQAYAISYARRLQSLGTASAAAAPASGCPYAARGDRSA